MRPGNTHNCTHIYIHLYIAAVLLLLLLLRHPPILGGETDLVGISYIHKTTIKKSPLGNEFLVRGELISYFDSRKKKKKNVRAYFIYSFDYIPCVCVCVCETFLHIKSLDGREELYRDGRQALNIIMIIIIG
jgi:hypothetical protein